MLDSTLMYKIVFQQYRIRDDNYKWLPSEEDWEKVKKIKPFLEVFSDVTRVFSSTASPTTNQFLPEVWKVKQVLFVNLTSEDDFIRRIVEKMSIKFDKYWSKCNALMAIAAVMDPRFKMDLIEFCFPEIYDSWEVEANISEVHKVLYEIYDIYVAEDVSSISGDVIGESSSTSAGGTSGVNRSGFGWYGDYLKRKRIVQPQKRSEMDIYLEEPVVDCSEAEYMSFQALDWWKLNASKFRVLSKMAHDILAIPISTVASESAFSAGGRTLSDYRSSLSNCPQNLWKHWFVELIGLELDKN